MTGFKILSGFSGLFLASCVGTFPPSVAQLSEPVLSVSRQPAPPNATPGTCWGQDATPAVIETVTEQIMLQPPEIGTDGSVANQAIYKTETRQEIVKERQEIWFETPCDAQVPADFIATLQRALKARGMFRGAVTGEMDFRTRRAIRQFQKPQGLDSSILSLAAARKLGLIAVERPAGTAG